METKLSVKQIQEMKHALGGQIKEDSYRNYYNSGSPCESWNELVELGFAVRRDYDKQRGGTYYHVTKDGIEVLKQIIQQ